MTRKPSSPRRSVLRVRYQHIERIYGQGQADEAGDDMVEALRLVSDWPGQFPYTFREDLAHPNPHDHSLLFEIVGMSAERFHRFLRMMAERGLIESEA